MYVFSTNRKKKWKQNYRKRIKYELKIKTTENKMFTSKRSISVLVWDLCQFVCFLASKSFVLFSFDILCSMHSFRNAQSEWMEEDKVLSGTCEKQSQRIQWSIAFSEMFVHSMLGWERERKKEQRKRDYCAVFRIALVHRVRA